ncbi:peptidoglycan editing factor PgeF [Alkalimarinus sediminis]|uniref:Purine nucleoside phosphorylase n=1 Tax=Alkalimarinus sediminis TaxID=1632866 RepID=A0A9E8KQW8_9ALTE|nr:peptidoglycan editing factor PgeF [Alkalimarinus sediminis]UZW76853.1 peptidoglycan editing factor PgeF [Alkalimarinus sediminis]
MPDWPLPNNVRALTTTRLGGFSLPPYDSFNLGCHVGDDLEHVQRNRNKLAAQCGLSVNRLQWLNQVHGSVACEALPDEVVRDADASYTRIKNTVCVIMTADCLPILFCDKQGRQVAAVHAGWRGLAGGVIESTLATFPAPLQVSAWLGPAIGPSAFEVGRDVVDAFTAQPMSSEMLTLTQQAFAQSAIDSEKWFANLYLLARIRLRMQGVTDIYGGEYCTWSDESQFYSYRRSGTTGRMASLIWLT